MGRQTKVCVCLDHQAHWFHLLLVCRAWFHLMAPKIWKHITHPCMIGKSGFCPTPVPPNPWHGNLDSSTVTSWMTVNMLAQAASEREMENYVREKIARTFDGPRGAIYAGAVKSIRLDSEGNDGSSANVVAAHALVTRCPALTSLSVDLSSSLVGPLIGFLEAFRCAPSVDTLRSVSLSTELDRGAVTGWVIRAACFLLESAPGLVALEINLASTDRKLLTALERSLGKLPELEKIRLRNMEVGWARRMKSASSPGCKVSVVRPYAGAVRSR